RPGPRSEEVGGEPEPIAQREELLLRRVTRRVLPLGRVRKHVSWSEHVAMCVHGAFGHLERRHRWIRMKRQPTGSNGERRRHGGLSTKSTNALSSRCPMRNAQYRISSS